jgi:glycosyltransferase involved in cell wall biosynthesis
MLFTALGFQKPVVIADSINPEVLAEYGIGVAFAPDEPGRLQAALERFVNTYESRKESYKQELARANVEFAPANFVKALLKLIDNRQGEK